MVSAVVAIAVFITIVYEARRFVLRILLFLWFYVPSKDFIEVFFFTVIVCNSILVVFILTVSEFIIPVFLYFTWKFRLDILFVSLIFFVIWGGGDVYY